MSTIKVGVNGARGRMGQITVSAVEAIAVETTGADGMSLAFGADKGDDLAALIAESQADVVVDFTIPAVVRDSVMTIIEAGARPVVGTTGLNQDDLEAIDAALKAVKLGGIVAPNFSVGAVLMMKLAAEAAAHFEACEIIEQHHPGKLDAPSGTAILTAGKIARMRPPGGKEKPDAPPGAGPSPALNALSSRGEVFDGIPVHSVRMPGRVAHQEVIFGGTGETLTIRHDSISRECFVPGILLAIRRVMDLTGLEVGLESLLGQGRAESPGRRTSN
jgi:4-hydroxy-tetrahydrodipicolinate reductase